MKQKISKEEQDKKILEARAKCDEIVQEAYDQYDKSVNLAAGIKNATADKDVAESRYEAEEKFAKDIRDNTIDNAMNEYVMIARRK